MKQLTGIHGNGGALKVIIIVLRVAAAIALLCTWVCIAKTFCQLALDYPLRRAGDNDEFPPLGTLPFYIGCAQALLGKNLLFIILFAVILAFIIKGCGVVSWRSRFLLSMMVLSLPIMAFGAHDIYSFMQYAKVHPDVIRHPHSPQGPLQ